MWNQDLSISWQKWAQAKKMKQNQWLLKLASLNLMAKYSTNKENGIKSNIFPR